MYLIKFVPMPNHETFEDKEIEADSWSNEGSITEFLKDGEVVLAIASVFIFSIEKYASA